MAKRSKKSGAAKKRAKPSKQLAKEPAAKARAKSAATKTKVEASPAKPVARASRPTIRFGLGAVLAVEAALMIVALGFYLGLGSGKTAQPAGKAASSGELPYNFPGGGRTLFPSHRLIAIYGTPQYPALGVLGQQSLPASITRVKALARTYQPLIRERALPTFEIIAAVASAYPTDNHDYSSETPPAQLKPWVVAARKAGVYVVLDLQPGRSNFLAQAKEYKSLLAEPNVGLALDPEWRLGPAQVPLAQIGSVSIAEVNSVGAWLANLTNTHHLPQKLFLLHQFRLDMINSRQRLDTSHPQLAYVIQMDGQGDQEVKAQTWRAITAEPHPAVRFGWKNFYAKDTPILSPKQTMSITPRPWYISYQ